MKAVLPGGRANTLLMCQSRTPSPKVRFLHVTRGPWLPTHAASSATLPPSHWPRAWADPESSSNLFFWKQLKTCWVERVANQLVSKLSWLNCTILSVSGATDSHLTISHVKNWVRASQMFARYKGESQRISSNWDSKEKAARDPCGAATGSTTSCPSSPRGAGQWKSSHLQTGQGSFSPWITWECGEAFLGSKQGERYIFF